MSSSAIRAVVAETPIAGATSVRGRAVMASANTFDRKGAAGRNASTGGSSSAAYRVGIASPHYDDLSADSVGVPLVTRLIEHYKDVNQFYVVPAAAGIAEASSSKLTAYCDDTRLNAIMQPLVRLRAIARAASATAGARRVDVSLALKVTDCSGEPFSSCRDRAGTASLSRRAGKTSKCGRLPRHVG